MMHVDKARSNGAKLCLEVEPTNQAFRTVMLDARRSGLWIALEAVRQNL
jgi:hypothetical protein